MEKQNKTICIKNEINYPKKPVVRKKRREFYEKKLYFSNLIDIYKVSNCETQDKHSKTKHLKRF